VRDRRGAPGAALPHASRDFWSSRWNGASFMAIGMQDPVLGAPVMHALRNAIRGCPAPMELPDAGHFTPEWGGRIAASALAAFLGY
jgi:haloalkane dehalogenase